MKSQIIYGHLDWLSEICLECIKLSGQQSLNEYLESKGIIAISDIDTRKLTRIIEKRLSKWLCYGGADR